MRNVGNLSSVARMAIPPATRLEHMLYPWVYFAILPLFALTNADVMLVGSDPASFFANPALFGVFFGLLLGKPIGIMLFSLAVVKVLKLAHLPENVTWRHVFGASILGGVGFTMAIFVANLAYANPADITTAKAGILAASTLAGVVGFLVLLSAARADAKRGVVYVTAARADANVQSADAEAQAASRELLDAIDDADRAQLEELAHSDGGAHEMAAHVKRS